MSVDSEEPKKRIVVFETRALFAERVDEENGCNGPILFAGNYCRSGAMEKLPWRLSLELDPVWTLLTRLSGVESP